MSFRRLSKKIISIVFLSLGIALEAAAETLPPIPPDLPLPAAPANDAKWLRGATILQPYGPSEYAALINPGKRPQRLKREFGFNAIIVQPPDSHNTVAAAKDRLTEEQFRAGVATYRAADFKLILYTSVMALGLSPEFQSGQVSREHPEWQQRDPKGNPVLAWGVPWLCPNTGAREVALARALRITLEYRADGIMLDNNEFFFAQAGWTCHCDGCTKAFREYVRLRCGLEGCQRLFGITPDKLKIPVDEGPLHALWLNWRNRSWAEINESFRASLRKANPKILFFANTQYAYENAMLGTDFQYQHEDVVLSESVSLNSRQMSEKMVLGHAVASGRPLWNYIGTFSKDDDYTGIKPAAIVGPLISATLANGARPWIVDGFDLGPTDPEARKEMARLLGWQGSHQEFFQGKKWAGVGAVFSIKSRNLLHRPLIPPHIASLQSYGTPVIGLRDGEISGSSLKPFKVITVETATCLDDQAAHALAKWVRKGGWLIAARDIGSFDELGRKRSESSLWQALDFKAAPAAEVAVGRGKIFVPEVAAFPKSAVQLTQPFSFRLPFDSGAEVVSYLSGESLLLHVVRHTATSKSLTLHLPGAFHTTKLSCEVFTPGSDEPETIPLSVGGGRSELLLTNLQSYCVVKIPLH